MNEHANRPKTIAANGEIVPKPYGAGRWANMRRRPCTHPGCEEAATILARTDAHATGAFDADGQPVRRAHNCCGTHD